jgi:hypothetical protein
MAHKLYHRAHKGEVYCAVWLEWHVDCAVEDCKEHLLVSPLGEAETLREAEKQGANDGRHGWKKIGGLWYCPKHICLSC